MSKLQSVTAPMRAVLIVLLLALTGLLSAPSALAQPNSSPPERMTYQGFLADGNGRPLGDTNTGPKNYDVIFRIWAEQTGGASSLWAEQQTVTVDKGYFSVLLGEGTALTSPVEPHNNLSTLFTGATASDRFVEMTVKGIGAGGSPVTILPRLRLLTSPYTYLASRALSASSVDGGAVTTGTVPDTRLSPNVALRAGGNSFTGSQNINGGLTVANASGSFNYWGFGPGSGTALLAGLVGANNNGPQFRFSGAPGGGWVDIGQNGVGDFVVEQADIPRLTIKPDGNVGIGTTTPGIPLTFANSLGDKISLWGQSGNTFGFGIQGNLLQIHTDGFASDIAFGYGSSASMVERMRIKGNGNVGIGTATPSAKLDVNGSLNVTDGITTGSGANQLPGHAPIIIEEKTANNQTLWNSKVVNIASWANRPGGFRISIYAQHETTYEVRNYVATVVVQQPGYSNDPNASSYNRISINWGAHGRASLILGNVLYVGNSCNGYQETYPDGWVKIGNVVLTSAGACGGGYDPGKNALAVTFHPAVSGQIVISDN